MREEQVPAAYLDLVSLDADKEELLRFSVICGLRLFDHYSYRVNESSGPGQPGRQHGIGSRSRNWRRRSNIGGGLGVDMGDDGAADRHRSGSYIEKGYGLHGWAHEADCPLHPCRALSVDSRRGNCSYNRVVRRTYVRCRIKRSGEVNNRHD